jgi:hypothetical protein
MNAMVAQIRITPDERAREWLAQHIGSHVIAYDVHRCCGGGKICQVSVRRVSGRDTAEHFTAASLDDGTTVLVDRRAAERLPDHFGLTVRGVGALKHLDLELEPEQWGDLLYA